MCNTSRSSTLVKNTSLNHMTSGHDAVLFSFKSRSLQAGQIQTANLSPGRQRRWRRRLARECIIIDYCVTLRHSATFTKNGYQLIPRRNRMPEPFWSGAVPCSDVARRAPPSTPSTLSSAPLIFSLAAGDLPDAETQTRLLKTWPTDGQSWLCFWLRNYCLD